MFISCDMTEPVKAEVTNKGSPVRRWFCGCMHSVVGLGVIITISCYFDSLCTPASCDFHY